MALIAGPFVREGPGVGVGTDRYEVCVGVALDGGGAGIVADVGGGVGDVIGICMVIEEVVFMPITSLRLTSSYVAGLMLDVTDAVFDAADSAELRLVDSPFMRLRIIWVAAVNCGIYGGRVGDMDTGGVLKEEKPGAGAGLGEDPPLFGG